jgi:hypothetical protein
MGNAGAHRPVSSLIVKVLTVWLVREGYMEGDAVSRKKTREEVRVESPDG